MRFQEDENYDLPCAPWPVDLEEATAEYYRRRIQRARNQNHSREQDLELLFWASFEGKCFRGFWHYFYWSTGGTDQCS